MFICVRETCDKIMTLMEYYWTSLKNHLFPSQFFAQIASRRHHFLFPLPNLLIFQAPRNIQLTEYVD